MNDAERPNARILVVDDDPTSRILASEALEQAGFAVETAENGLTAIKLVADFRPDLVLLDIVMPELNGFETCVEIKNLPDGLFIPIVIMTGLDDAESVHRAFLSGAISFVTKPINPLVLVYQIRHILNVEHMAAELRLSEARLRAIVESSPAGIMLKDEESRVVLANPALCRLWDLSPGDVLGKCVEDFQPPHLAARSRAADADIRNGKKLVAEKYCREARDGSRRHFSDVSFPIRDRSDEFLGIGGIVTDITERTEADEALRSSEAMLRTLVDNIPAAVVLEDVSGEYIHFNRQFERWHGGSVRAMGAGNLFPAEIASRIEEADRAVMEGRAPLQFEMTVPMQNGSDIAILASKFPIMNSDGKVVRIGTIATDITAIKNVEEALRAAKDSAEAANEVKRQFLAKMSHELRTPLNAILGFSEGIVTELFGAIAEQRYVEYGAYIHQSGLHLLDIVNDILDLAKIEAGKMELSETIVDVREIFDNCLRTVEPQAKSKAIKLTLEKPCVLPGLWADGRLVTEILLNLLSNAVKFTSVGGDISLSASLTDSGGLEFVVTDTGVGMNQDDLARALEPFGQVRPLMTTPVEGTGLGLSLVKKFVELHDATMNIESKRGAGTRVVIHFPTYRTVALPQMGGATATLS